MEYLKKKKTTNPKQRHTKTKNQTKHNTQASQNSVFVIEVRKDTTELLKLKHSSQPWALKLRKKLLHLAVSAMFIQSPNMNNKDRHRPIDFSHSSNI